VTDKITGVQAWGADGQMWGLDPAQVAAAQANPAVARIRVTYACGRQAEIKPNIRNPTAHQS
jgi:hypothetical protein